MLQFANCLFLFRLSNMISNALINRKAFIETDSKRGLGQSPNGGLGGPSPPTAKPSNNFIRF